MAGIKQMTAFMKMKNKYDQQILLGVKELIRLFSF